MEFGVGEKAQAWPSFLAAVSLHISFYGCLIEKTRVQLCAVARPLCQTRDRLAACPNRFLLFYSEAIERAQYLDDYLARTGKTLGPLHGLPISLKDSFITSPHPRSICMAAYANEPTDKDTTLVNILRGLGAVFYCKTNVPVAMMMAETNNNVWGECINPLHKGLSPGGSSGGEGAVIAFNASPIGPFPATFPGA